LNDSILIEPQIPSAGEPETTLSTTPTVRRCALHSCTRRENYASPPIPKLAERLYGFSFLTTRHGTETQEHRRGECKKGLVYHTI